MNHSEIEKKPSMKIKFAPLAATVLAGFALTACSQTPTKTAEVPRDSAKPSISAEAQKALDQAEVDIETAREKFALWTSAETALKQAREAAQAGDSAAVIKLADFVAIQVKGGLAQLSYPSTEQK